MKDLLNRPLWILAILVLFPVGVFILKVLNKKKCPYCKTGIVQEVSSTPEEVVHYNQNNSGDSRGGHSTSVVRVKVKYQCSHCKEFYEVQENR